jgi:hypothetical protein
MVFDSSFNGRWRQCGSGKDGDRSNVWWGDVDWSGVVDDEVECGKDIFESSLIRE